MIQEELRSLVNNVCSKLIKSGGRLDVSVYMTTRSIVIQIIVDKDDRGKIIGKGGSTIAALQHVCTAIKGNILPLDRRLVNLEVMEDGNDITEEVSS